MTNSDKISVAVQRVHDNRIKPETQKWLQDQLRLQNHFMEDARYYPTKCKGVFIESYRKHYWLVSSDWITLYIGVVQPTKKQISQYNKCGRITY